MIKLLPQNIRDQIAAGEVVERPASVVKELVENSLDAGADIIEIWVEAGGKDLIKIKDNGAGMSAQDAKLSVERHATSKITSTDDLFNLHSFGFRGEALAAISAVSDFTLLSKTKESDEGTLITIESGNFVSQEIAPSSTGTTITIKDLFKPVPARKQYLKTDETEYRQILKLIQSFSLAHAAVSFRLYKDDKTTLDYPAESHSKSRVKRVLKKRDEDLVEVNFSGRQITLSGFISTPDQGSRSKRGQYLFVNQRPIEDHLLSFAVREAYVQSCGIEKHLHPHFALFITLDPILVDVNVHPRKTEVKFAESHEVFRELKNAVAQTLHQFSGQQTLSGASKTKISTFTGNSGIFTTSPVSPKKASQSFNFNQQLSQNSTRFSDLHTSRPVQSSNINTDTDLNLAIPNLKSDDEYKLIGQVGKRYILVEVADKLYVFDQHALHERQRFEQFWQEYKNTPQRATQELLVPQVITMTEATVSILSENNSLLKQLGFQVQFPEDDKIEIKTLPVLLGEKDLKSVLENITEFIQNEKLGEHVLDQLMRKLLEYKACRGAVMYGDALDRSEMEKLIQDFDKTDWKLLCPHGRPNHFVMTFDELDHQFHR